MKQRIPGIGSVVAQATLGRAGRITIPAVVRDRLGFTTGDRVEFVELPSGQVLLEPLVDDVRSLKGVVQKRASPLSAGAMRRIVARRAGGAR
jgi:AbrB family looped-hinge helix DNA binding protein